MRAFEQSEDTEYGIGKFAPGCYRAVFRDARHVDFDPVQVGVGLGLTQGCATAAAVGLVVVGIHVWLQSRQQTVAGNDPTTRPANDQSPESKSADCQADGPALKCVLALLGPWLLIGTALAVLPVMADPRSAYGPGYLVLFAALLVILGCLAVGITLLMRSTRHRRSVATWLLIAGSLLNLWLLSQF